VTEAGRPGHGARTRGGLLLLFLALTLAVINGSQWFVLSRVTSSLEAELALRLQTVATAAVSTVSPGLLLDPDVAADPLVSEPLLDIALQNDLTDVFLVDPEGVVLFDLDDSGVGEPNPFLELDARAFSRALEGDASASELVELGGAILKAAYAPVIDPVDGTVAAVLGVTAGTVFYERLPALRQTAWGVSIGSAVLVVLLSLIFFGMLRRLSTTEGALARAETLSAMGLLAAGVAHEIRNPLAIITGTAQRLKSKYGGGGGDELFDFIPEEVERLNGILEGYLRFARDEPLVFGECDAARVVERGCSTLRAELEGRGVEVAVEGTDGPLPRIRADPLRLRQVLLNLLLNSAQAMPRGGRIRVGLEDAGRDVQITVEDTGSGFDAKALRAAFQPFFTTKEHGSGLGLAVAKRIVDAHGGTIALANREEGGARVVLRLPVDGPSRSPRGEG